LHYHSNKESAEEIKNLIQKAGGEALLVKADLRNETSISNLFREIERVHDSVTVFVNAVTLPIINTSFSDLEWDSIENHFNLNIKSTFFILKNIVPLMKKVKYGKIVNLTTQAIDSPITEWLHYITAKSALSGFSKALALELAPYGIRVNLVSPGMTDTDLLAHISEKAKLLTVAKTPLRKIASPKDVANAIAFLCGPDSDHITGETIRINGGMVII
jgi:3-oxoacyl-[acyl-carrier protein] reductase